MANSVISDMTSPLYHGSPQSGYRSKMSEDFSSTSPEHANLDHRGHTRSPSMGASTLTPSAPSERADDKSRHFSDGSQVNYAEISSPEPQFLDISKYRNSDKEAYRNSTLSGNTAQDGTLAPIKDEEEERPRQSDIRRRRLGLTIPVFWTIIGGLIVVILALALGLGLGLGLRNESNGTSATEDEASEMMIGGAINPKYYSTQGAFNGTGIAIASTSSGVDPDIFVFYQRYNGEIHQLLRSADGNWLVGTTVANDARNATPITSVAYNLDDSDGVTVATVHVFYIDVNNIVRQKTSTNRTQGQENIWMDGPLNDLNLQSIDSELVGLQACYWGNYYGSATNVNQPQQPTRGNPTTGMNLFYAADNSTFEQYDWTNGQSAWNRSNTFSNMNTRAGVACQTWLSGTTQYLFMVDPTNTLKIMWRDTDTNKTSTPDHPINEWTDTTISIANLHPSSSLGYTDFLAYQDTESLFHGVNITWAAENTSIATIPSTNGGPAQNDQWVIDSDVRGIPSSHMAITALDTASGGRQLAILYQSIDPSDQGDGITIGWRDSSSQGGWSKAFVPVNGTTS